MVYIYVRAVLSQVVVSTMLRSVQLFPTFLSITQNDAVIAPLTQRQQHHRNRERYLQSWGWSRYMLNNINVVIVIAFTWEPW